MYLSKLINVFVQIRKGMLAEVLSGRDLTSSVLPLEGLRGLLGASHGSNAKNQTWWGNATRIGKENGRFPFLYVKLKLNRRILVNRFWWRFCWEILSYELRIPRATPCLWWFCLFDKTTHICAKLDLIPDPGLCTVWHVEMLVSMWIVGVKWQFKMTQS